MQAFWDHHSNRVDSIYEVIRTFEVNIDRHSIRIEIIQTHNGGSEPRFFPRYYKEFTTTELKDPNFDIVNGQKKHLGHKGEITFLARIDCDPADWPTESMAINNAIESVSKIFGSTSSGTS